MEENKLADEGQAEIGFAAYYNVVFFTHMICLVGVIWLFYIWFSKLWKCFFDHFGGTSMSPAAGGSSSHSNLEKIKYDVFISFRGEDTRSTFTSHLHHELYQKKIKAFMDEDDLKKGHEISPALKKAIEESKLCLVILSEHYATSRWCLEELVHILNFKGQAEVLPIFYKVDPSDVRKQQSSYKAAFDGLRRNPFNNAKLPKWRDALTKIADLSGWASNEYRDESQLVATIVEDVIEKLKDMSVASDELQGWVGIVEKIKEIEQLLQIGSSNVGPIGIWGPGGIGKTTLAKAVCKRLSSHFETCVFLNNVREELEKHGPTHLEDKLFSELLEGESRARFARDRIRCKKVLVVFDDVDDAEQCEQLITGFGAESRIIITSRDKQVLRNIGVIEPYEVEGLDDVEALKLFSLHAFKKNSPTANRKELSNRAVHYAGGFPLALIVLGRLLFSKPTEVWRSTLDKLEKFPDKKIEKVLRISYDALDDTQKQIFLDIALVLKGDKRDFVQEILDGCDFYATAGIDVLIDKALITVGNLNTLEMHDLLQTMAFQIVRPHSTNQDPRKGSRLTDVEDICQALENDRGLETIEAISLDTSKCSQEISLLPATFSKLRVLRLLIIKGNKLCLPEGPPPFPDTLRYLNWDAYPLKSLPTNVISQNVVAIHMRDSQLVKLWEGSPDLNKLKFFDVSGSKHLTQVPDLSKAPNIKRVNLEFCASLIEVPSYFRHLEVLEELYLIGCPSLCYLSGLPKNLKTLKVLTEPLDHQGGHLECILCGHTIHEWFPSLDFSSKLEKFPDISEPMKFLGTLKLDFAAIKVLPHSIINLIGLKQLSLRFCKNLELLPYSIRSLSSLRELSIVFCQKLESLPVLPPSLSMLDAICCTSLKTLSRSIPSGKQNWDDLYNKGYEREKFRFLGCQMLEETARNVLVEEALFRTLRFATILHKYGPGRCNWSYVRGMNEVYWPGSEIPGWFSHRSEGCSLCINLPHPDEWYNSSYLGLVYCVIVEYNDVSKERPFSLRLDWNSIYTFPNGDSWRQRKEMNLNMLGEYRDCAFGECFSTYLTDFHTHNIHDSLNNSEYVYLVMEIYDTYGDFLKSNNGKFDAYGNKSPRTAKDNFTSGADHGEYFKAKEGMFDANGSAFSRTATASFTFELSEYSRSFAKINKCGVHLLCTQEAERFGYVERIEFESNGDEAIQAGRGGMVEIFTIM